MRTRLLSALFMIPLLLCIIFFAPGWLISATLGVLCALCVHELLWQTKFVQNKRRVAYAMCFSFGVPMWVWTREIFNLPNSISVGALLIFCVLLFTDSFVAMDEGGFSQVCVIFTISALVPFLFSSCIRLYMLDNSAWLMLCVFVVCISTDSFAMLGGMLLGKHKLLPKTSPKKTVEGSICGIVMCVAFTMLYALIVDHMLESYQVRYIPLAIIAVVGAVLAQMGDLFMSMAKRQFAVKDFGHLIPGHGGLLDRLDSMLLVAPFVELCMITGLVVVKL